MSKVTMPGPVAYLRSDQLKKLGDPHQCTVGVHSKSGAVMLRVVATRKLAEQYGHCVAVITADQAEAYANALAAERVREALENAAQVILGGISDESLVAAPTTRRNAANEVLALIPKQ